MDQLVTDEGITSFKLFMAYPGVFYSDDGQILRAMQKAARQRRDDHDARGERASRSTCWSSRRWRAARPTRSTTASPGRQRWRPRRPAGRSCSPSVAGDCPLYIVHLSASRPLEQVAAARDAGRNVFAETCPQYLYLTLEDQLGAPGFEGAKWVCSTPLRSKHETHRADLWKGLRSNDLPIVSTDHCPFCMKDQKELGLGDFSKIPNGIGGVEHRVDLIYQGVVDGQLSLERWVETSRPRRPGCSACTRRRASSRPARTPTSSSTTRTGAPAISVETHHMNMDHSAYEGFEIAGPGRHRHLARRGDRRRRQRTIGRKGHGQFLRRGLSSYLV